MGGAPRLFGNAATRSLMRRTKWYLGFLDWLGIVDAKTTPDELAKKYSDLDSKVNQYNTTEDAQQSWSEDFGSKEGTEVLGDTETKVSTPKTSDKLYPINMLMGSLFK